MPKTEEFILSRLLWKAKNYGLPQQFSFFFNELSPAIQLYLNNKHNTTESGTPGLFFTKPTNEWTLICTKQVIYNDNNNITAINLRDIDKISSTVFDPTLRIQGTDFRKLKTKSEWDTIKVTTKQGHAYILHANKGSELFGLWDILLMMVSLNQENPTIIQTKKDDK
jgi:hypothetical protein